ncbi:MAG: MAPEG family protein [Proteobacteria bacterium]|nr:MAPEG family protein [Pseudomonadota bacterium]
MVIVPFYASLLALFFIALSIRTLLLRRRLKIAIGDAGDAAMLRAMRVHANFVEYVPLSLVMLAFMELGGAPPWRVHVLCAGLLIGRLSHAWGVSQVREDYRFRMAGVGLTLIALVSAATFVLGVSAPAVFR